MSATLLEDLVQAYLRGRFKREPKPVRRLAVRSKGMIIVEIEDRKPPCTVCGKKIPRGRHFTCGIDCQRREILRVADGKKIFKASQIPKMPMGKRVGQALGGLFG